MIDSKNDSIDLLVTGLQVYFKSKLNMTYSRIRGINGTKLSRVAFAIIIKFAGLTSDLQQTISELEYASISLPEELGRLRD